MTATETDEILTTLANLPAPTQNAATRALTLTRTLRALAPDGTDRSRLGDARRTAIPSFLGRWLASERLVPAVLCLAGALYAHGVLRQLGLVFGADPAAPARAAHDCGAVGQLVAVATSAFGDTAVGNAALENTHGSLANWRFRR